MATTFKPLGANDIISTKTLLHENIPLTGTIVSGTYADANIKNYSHGMFQAVYDYPYLSSSANHIFDITLGYSSVISQSSNTTQQEKKLNIYNQMAQMLVGYDTVGSILRFDADGDLLAGGTKHDECIFINFSRLLVKDEIKKGSFNLTLNTGKDYMNPGSDTTSITDYNGATKYRINSPAGEYSILYATASTANNISVNAATSSTEYGYVAVGLLYYQAGIAVLTASIFADQSTQQGVLNFTGVDTLGYSPAATPSDHADIRQAVTGSSIETHSNNIRNRIANVSFNNTTELNSTIYFCRVNHNEYNYSANPTYLSSSQIRVKTNASEQPVSYITTVGLYSADNQLLAVGKLSEPLRKDPTVEYTLRARLDF